LPNSLIDLPQENGDGGQENEIGQPGNQARIKRPGWAVSKPRACSNSAGQFSALHPQTLFQ
jgi:hypothetical protein